MRSVLEKAIETICHERDTDCDVSFNCVDDLIAAYGEPRFAETIFEEISRSIPFEIVADIFNVAIWSTSDNGMAITDTTNVRLLECKDVRKMLVALNLEILAFRNKKQAIEALNRVPDEMWIVRPHIQRTIRSWEKVDNKLSC